MHPSCCSSCAAAATHEEFRHVVYFLQEIIIIEEVINITDCKNFSWSSYWHLINNTPFNFSVKGIFDKQNTAYLL